MFTPRALRTGLHKHFAKSPRTSGSELPNNPDNQFGRDTGRSHATEKCSLSPAMVRAPMVRTITSIECSKGSEIWNHQGGIRKPPALPGCTLNEPHNFSARFPG